MSENAVKNDKKVKKQVKKFMTAVKDFLKSKNGGKVPAEWGCSLMILETYYEQFCILTNEINELPSLVQDSRYGVQPHPLLGARDKTTIRLEAMLKQFGLTFKEAAKMEIVEPVAEESALEAFMKNKVEKR